ncbi:response regulator [Paenibacillus tianjinensis]|uniref:Response regulator n=1 Tax=Paenibacillus tianjinensis TaxID=2810347 RepID=A0ABX7LDR3_9BACL|nr:response regulator [Paenibacillus tianjinensis]QSF46269.1 response regulator [Paenibacillus tianjinensis]
MKKVMLVDDEILIRESIRECVDWEKEGFIYCGDAPDGELALPLIEQQIPDILITDIKMPFMDGLELSSVVRQRLPQIKIIILSGHNDFQYAQTALRLGVEDYCLKPFSSADLIQLLHAVSARIDEEQRLKRRYAYTPEKLFADLCGGLIGTAAAIEAADQLELQLTTPYYAVAILALSPSDPQETEIDHAACQSAQQLIDERLSELQDIFMYKRSRTETVVILKGSRKEELSSKMKAFTDSLNMKLKASFNCVLSLSLGNVQDRLQGIHISYLEAEEEKTWKKISKQNKAALWAASFDSPANRVLLDRNRLVDFLKLGSSKEAPAFIRQFTAEMSSISWDSMYAYYLINDLTLEMVLTAKKSFHTGRNTEDMMKDLQQQIRNIASFEECQYYLLTLLEQLWKWRLEGSDKYGELIDKVKLHIRQHYDDDQLSLFDISRQIGVSSSHLSKIFSQETGQTMTEYLTFTRISKAKELLKTTRSKTFEIAFQVGYNDQHYFSNLFKKVTGMTPTEYRKHGFAEDQGGRVREGGSNL